MELESLIDVLFSVDNVSAVVNYSANGILHRCLSYISSLNAVLKISLMLPIYFYLNLTNQLIIP